MAQFAIDQLYDYMSPKGALIARGVTKQNSMELLEKLLMGEVYMYPFEKIKQFAEGGIDIKNDPDVRQFHGIGNVGHLFKDDDYFSSAKVNSSDQFMPADLRSKKKLSVFVSRNPFVSVARRSTNDVDFFLNYTPSVFASQLIPYLDVELQVIRSAVSSPEGSRTFATNITSPSLMRFLMGSIPINDPSLGVAGKAIEMGQDTLQKLAVGGVGDKVDTLVAYSGMEMFLAPQTLTNMDELKGGNGRRLVDAKPFVPFASIEGMDISFANAGAGTMIHKKGTLRLKIHDKARIAEMAPFLKPGGFAYVNVVTTYGWVAPDRGDEDVYSAFVNEKMMSQDTWMVSNSSYSFDSTGQVNIILEMVSLGYRKLQTAEVLAPGKLSSRLKEFDELIAKVQQVAAAIQKRVPVADLKVIQTLSGISGRSLPDMSKLGDSVDQMVKKLTAKGGEAAFQLPPGSFAELKQNVDKLIQSTKPNGVKTLVEQLDLTAKETAREAFSDLCNSNDPFLPGNKSPQAAEKFYSKMYRGHLDNAITPSQSKVVSAGPRRNIVSFGSVFSKVATDAILRQDTCDELQVIFYCLNDSCGPVSGQSIAEFPLDVDRLEYEYANAMKLNGKVTLENFLRSIIDSQVTDKRAVAYGMAPAYEKWSPEKQQITNDQKNYDNAMLDWHSQYGSFVQPLIEIFVESGVEGADTNKLKRLSVSAKTKAEAQSSTRIIKRIHIYDVNASPFNGLQKILRVGDSFIFGDVKPPEKFVTGSDWFKNYLQNKSTALKQVEESLLVDELVKTTEMVPGYEQYNVKSNSRELIQHVSSFAPSIRIGSNGSMVINAALASKTNGLDSAANIIRQNAAYAGQGGVLPPANGLEDPNGMPLRMAPAQLTLQTVGCPIAAAYQQYFIDLGTGTTLDNLYTCTSVKHTIAPGKFTSDWTFLYTDAYGKFAGAPSIVAAATRQIQKIVEEAESSQKNGGKSKATAAAAAQKKTPPAAPAAPKPPAAPVRTVVGGGI